MFPNPAWQDRQEENWLRDRIKLNRFKELTSGVFGLHGSTFQCRYVIESPQYMPKFISGWMMLMFL